MKAIDELRNEICIFRNNNIDTDELVRIADAIERELEERYVELPVDGDGVPIHLLDHLKVDEEIGVFVVGNMTCCTDGWLVGTNRGQIGRPEEYAHHYKPPTVEDLLLECCNKYHGLLIEGMSDIPHDMPAPAEIIAEYAERLKLKGDE